MRLKSELYATEQRAICDKVIEILALDEAGSAWLPDLDVDRDKQRRLLELIPDIRTYFTYSDMTGVKDPRSTVRPWLSVARSVTKPFYTWERREHRRDHKRSARYFLRARHIPGVIPPEIKISH